MTAAAESRLSTGRLTRARRLVLIGLLLAVAGVGLWLLSGRIRAEYHQRRAAAALERQRYASALAEYRAALRFRPDDAALQLLAGRTARRAGELAAARDYLSRCRELQGGVSEEQQVEEYLLRAQSGELDEAHPFLLPYLLQEGPLTPLVLEGLVRAYMGKYRVELAWNCLTRWLQLEPDNAEAYFRRGAWYAQHQNLDEAIADFRRALEIDPERIETRLALAEMYTARRNFAEIEEQFRLILKQSPGDSRAILGLAKVFLETGRQAEARRLFDELPESEHKQAEALRLLGQLERSEGHPEKAEAPLRAALALQPRHVPSWYQLMLCVRQLGREDEARAIRARFEQIERYEKRLIEITTRDLNQAPRSADLHAELGEIYLHLGVTERGLHWLNAALRLDPDLRRAHEALRKHYESLGNEGKERAEYHRRQQDAIRAAGR